MYATLTSLLGHASLCLESLCWSGLTVHINITSFILLYKASLLSYRIIMLGLHRKYTKLALFLVQCILKGSRVCKYVLHRICVCMKHKYNKTNSVCFWASITLYLKIAIVDQKVKVTHLKSVFTQYILLLGFISRIVRPVWESGKEFILTQRHGYWILLSCTTGNSLSHWKPRACIRVGVHRETRQEINWIFPSRQRH